MKEKITGIIHNFRSHWKTPAQGRYMSFKEIISLSVGSIGYKFITYCIGQMIITTTNVLIGNTIGIEPGKMYVIYILSVVSGFPLTALRAKMIDSTRSMKGKYRPYILTMGIPTMILGMMFILTPYERIASRVIQSVIILAYNIGFQFFYNFYIDVFDSIVYVLSPNSIERSDVFSIKSVIENLSPSIANIFLPVAAKLITGENTLYSLKVYRVLFPPMLAAGFLISVIAYVNTEEKIVQAKTHVIKMRFIDAFKSIAKNKYFWIISLAGWLGFLETSFSNIMGWMYNYQKACSAAQYSLITAISGNASFWPNLIAPYFIRKYGKRNILVITNLMNIFFILLMLPIVRRAGRPGIIWLLLICTFVNQLISALGHLLNPSIQADIRDYQQYVTGERIDGMFSAVGLIGSVITLATSSVLPTIYERSGLNAENAAALGYTNIYDVLYNTDLFVSISSVLVIASMVGAFLNVIPFFFYDLKESDQKGMVAVLKIRALFEDYANGVLSDDKLIETGDIITEAIGLKDTVAMPVDKAGDKYNIYHGREKKKAIKNDIKQYKELSVRLSVAQRVRDELEKFSTPAGISALEFAKKIVESQKDGHISIEIPDKAQAKAMPKNTAAEKEIRRNTLMQIESFKTSEKAVRKYFPDGIVPFDSAVFEELFAKEDTNEKQLKDTLDSLKEAKQNNQTDKIPLLKQSIASMQQERKLIASQIKKASEDYSRYYRAAKPLLDAEKLIAQSENYNHLEEILNQYKICKQNSLVSE